jgi:hypothetical protein
MSVCCECCVLCVVRYRSVLGADHSSRVPECDGEASIMRRPWPTRGCCAMGEKIPWEIYGSPVKRSLMVFPH